MIVETVKIDDLVSPDYNPRHITPEALESLKQSIDEFGYIDPLIVNSVNMHVVGGNQRLECLKALDYEEVEVIFINEPDINREKAINIRLNNSSGDWDIGKLDNLFNELELEGFDLTLTGFATENLQPFETSDDDTDIPISETITSDLNTGLKPENSKIEVTEDDYEESDDLEVTVQQGDIYQLGKHRLMCGDSTKEKDAVKLMNGVMADMLFTDPPYGYEYQSNMRTKTKKFDVIKNDDTKLDFMPIVKKFNNGFVFVCTTWKVLKEWLELFTKYYDLSNMIIWDKGGGGIGDLKHTFNTDYEIILCSNNNQEITGKRIGCVWNIPKDNANDYIHPTQKPVKVSATAIQNTTNENDNILDLFGGSGSTLIACEQLNRNCYMMELDPYYCQVIINRWEHYTGQKAVKIN